MHRRELLSRVCAVGTVGAVAASNATDGISARETSVRPPGPIAVNRTAIDAAVVDRSPASVAVRLRASARTGDVAPVVVKRRYPDGAPLAVRDGPRLRVASGLDRRFTVAFDERVADRFAGPWLYEVRCRTPGRPDWSTYLCESEPVRRSPFGGVDAGPELVTDPDGASSDGVRFERTALEGRYELRFQWLDSTPSPWELEFAIGKSAYERARNRPRGLVRTFLESRRSPYAHHLADRIAARASDPDGSGDAAGEDPLSAAERLERAVGFVQGLPHDSDSNSKGRPEYHRTVEESIVDGTADCNDRTYLLAGLLSHPSFGYETALVVFPDHLLLGVRRGDLPPSYRDRETIGESPYVPIETTANVPIGSYRDDPVVAVLGDGYRDVDPGAIDSTLGAQLRSFADYVGS